jgi:hypothetical protein
MAHFIDKDALVEKIERRTKYNHERAYLDRSPSMAGRENEDKDILSLIDTLEVKEVDLDDFIKEEFNKYSCVDGYGQLSVSYNMAEFYGMIKRLTKAQKGE